MLFPLADFSQCDSVAPKRTPPEFSGWTVGSPIVHSPRLLVQFNLRSKGPRPDTLRFHLLVSAVQKAYFLRNNSGLGD